MNRSDPIDDTTLHAYVDGQLSAADAAQVAQWLQDQPEQAARVLAWQVQRSQLQALQAEVLDEALPAALLAALRDEPGAATPRAGAARWRWSAPFGASAWGGALAAGLLLAVGLGLGLGLGWTARGRFGSAPVDTLASGAAVPGFVRDAALAHVLYTPEQRHPVEVGAEQQQHLVQWLSKRLGVPLHVPVLGSRGWALVGGRLLPAGETGGGAADTAGTPIARAQFMYEAAAGRRLTLYVAVGTTLPGASGRDAATAFRLARGGAGAAGEALSFYWVDGPLAYALTGVMSADELAELAALVHQQLARG